MSTIEAEHYIGVDIGTGSARVCIVDRTGDIKAVASKDIRTWQPQNTFYEQSTSDIWSSISTCVKQALKESNVDPATVRGIGFCATCSLAVFSDDTNEPVSVSGPDFSKADQNVILWLDHRAVEEAKVINATDDNVLKYVGGQMSVEMEIPKILWLKNHMLADVFASCKFYDLTDALTHMATGKDTRSYCSTVCKQGYLPKGADTGETGWRDDFFGAIGLGCLKDKKYAPLGGIEGQRGQYLSAGELVGSLSESAAKDMGLPAGIAVGSGVIDAYAGWIGTVGAKHEPSQATKGDISDAFGRLALVGGTSTCHLVMSKDPIFVNGVWGPYLDVLVPGMWMAEGGQSATGELLRFIIENHPAYEEAKSLAKQGGKDKSIYEFLNDHLAVMTRKAGAPSVSYVGRHFFFYGDFFGNRSPLADVTMAGSIIGLTTDQSVDNLALHYYGAMEFISLQTRHIVDSMNTSGHSIGSLYMSGSQCKNSILMLLIATICGLPVVIPEYAGAAVVHGAAMLGAKAASANASGNTEELWSIMERMSKPGKLIQPGTDTVEKALFEIKYEVFLDQAKMQQLYRRKVDEAIGSWK
ncbi:hypothetical protein VC83_07520 [Pseudogymnoascus destructans]|uniref:Carbohydrate kinase FGGY C-terminal domain-containing protein n=2 Tax=Pseudogymnoascus destructans TaxID=655981 RepID=L8G412_PSED2|nr:uncharacterized protein VC83_07520 [Pseudogymnoascus destructans]ELR07408.1 hypothetical protein GMDG_02543 [Pseudogymnoascus destructans 20631-21]OAF56208.1 hypothetical protein VC83_07520 [Pseudogymnoascus destructans]